MGERLDLQPETFMEWFLLPVGPDNGFVMYKDEFSSTKATPRRAIKSPSTLRLGRRSPTVIEK